MKFNERNVFVSSRSKIGKNVKIGDNAVIYDEVEIGDNTNICNDTIVGEPLAAYYSDAGYQNPPTVIGSNSLIRSHSIIYAGCNIGNEFSTGHRTTIRENTVIGSNCSIGTMSDIQADVRIGDYCRIHSLVHIGQYCSMGDFVFIYPYCVMTNDIFPPSEEVKGGYIGNYTQVAVHTVILPGIRVGENCLIGANSVVSKRIPNYSFAGGNPAIVIRDVRKIRAMGKGQVYPWQRRFKRGMPWEEIGYDAWVKQQSGE